MRGTLDLYRAFLAIYRAGSVTAAAERLQVAQPTLSAQLRSLESSLGRQLFERQARGVVPTPAADELARRIGPPLDALERVVFSGDQGYLATVRLGGPADFLTMCVVPALASLVADGVPLRTIFGMPDQLLEDLVVGRLDLVISSVRPRRHDVVATPLYDEEFTLVAAPLWAAALPGEVSPSTLASVPLVGYGEEAPILRRYWRTVFGTRLDRSLEVTLPDLRGVASAVAAGVGASVLPRYLVDDELRAGAVQELLQPQVPPLNTLFIARAAVAPVRRSVARVEAQLLAAASSW